MKTKSILIVAPSRKTRGGITAVVEAYEGTDFWKKCNCKWIETHIDRGFFRKLLYFIHALMVYLPQLPVSRLIHIHLSEPASAIRKSFFAIPAFLLRKPVILHFHSFSSKTTLESRFGFLYRYLFSRARYVIVLSPFWRREIVNMYGNVSVEVVLNPCPNISSERTKSTIMRSSILFAGTLIARKGYSELIHAFSMIAYKHPKWDLVLAGNGEIESAKEIAEKRGVGKRVLLPGWVSGKEKAKLFKNAMVFCLPSYAEGFPMALMDAFAYGLPVVATPVGGITDFIENGVSGYLVPYGDVTALSEALSNVMDSSALRETFSRASLKLAAGPFNIEKLCKQMETIYSSCISP